MENERHGKQKERGFALICDLKAAAAAVISSYADKKKEGADTPHALMSAARAAAPAALRLCAPALYFICSILLASVKIYGGIYPMALAFVSACGKNLLFAYSGAALGAVFFGADKLITLSSYTAAVVVRMLLSFYGVDDDGNDTRLFDFYGSVKTKMSVAAAGALAMGVYGFVANDFSFESLAAMILLSAMTPVLTYFYSGALGADDFGPAPVYREAGVAALIVSLVFSLRGLTLFTLDLAAVSAFSITLIAVLRRGFLRGSVLGLFLGLTLPVSLVPVYAAAGASAGLLYRRSPYLAISLSFLTSLTYITYAGGYSAAIRLLPEYLCASLIISGALAVGFLRVKERSGQAEDVPSSDAELYISKRRDEQSRGLLTSEAQAFSSLSDMFYRLSDKLRRPSLYDIRQLCDSACAAHCKKCRSRASCWLESDGEAESAVSLLTKTLYENGVVTDADIPDFFNDRCLETKTLVKRINERYAAMLERLISTDKTEVIAFDYESMSAVLSDIISQREGEYDYNIILSDKLTERLRRDKIGVGRVCVYGDRSKTVYMSALNAAGIRTGAGALRELTQKCCGGAFSSPSYSVRGSEISATLTSIPVISAEFGRSQSIKEDSRANGDIAICFECRGDRFCALISDGMGSGREAALTSGICALFIEKMMSAGNSASVTLKMLNCMLRARKSECSSSVDLLELDLLTGRAKFIKSGAAPSFIVRGGDVYKIHSRTVPVGIIRTLDAEQTTVDVAAGDLIVMISDGVAQNEEECAALYSALTELRCSETGKIASEILRMSKKRRRGEKSDDATVCVIRIAPPLEEENI